MNSLKTVQEQQSNTGINQHKKVKQVWNFNPLFYSAMCTGKKINKEKTDNHAIP